MFFDQRLVIAKQMHIISGLNHIETIIVVFLKPKHINCFFVKELFSQLIKFKFFKTKTCQRFIAYFGCLHSFIRLRSKESS